MPSSPQRSKAETVKENSRRLRGRVIEELALENPGFSGESVQILKFHGIYQQGDRDAPKGSQQLHPTSMVRVGVPGGLLTAAQYLAMDRLADEVGDGGLRITSRQDIQFHRVGKGNLRSLLRTLNGNLLTTLAACGDVVRNVTCCPAPFDNPVRREIQHWTSVISKRFKPTTRAYYEIWLDGEKAATAESAAEETEPVLGPAYLPRKFKIGCAAPGDNCIDVYTNDVGLVPLVGRGGLEAFTVLVGGGLGMSPGVKATHPRLADPLATVPSEQLERVLEAIITLHRDYGNRENRKLARLKYVLEAWGIDRFRSEVEERLGCALAPPQPLFWTDGVDHLGWHAESGGCWFLGLPVPSGRVKDGELVKLRTGIREVVERFGAGVRLTPQQNILLSGIRGEQREDVEESLRSRGVRLAGELPPVLRQSMACPALPTCSLAITEAERVLPEVLQDIRGRLEDHGLGNEPLTVRMTGCPNGCARPLTAEIGLVGESLDLYGVYLGGSPTGTRLAFLFAGKTPRREIANRLAPVFAQYGASRRDGERFGDFCYRLGVEALQGANQGASQ